MSSVRQHKVSNSTRCVKKEMFPTRNARFSRVCWSGEAKPLGRRSGHEPCELVDGRWLLVENSQERARDDLLPARFLSERPPEASLAGEHGSNAGVRGSPEPAFGHPGDARPTDVLVCAK